MVTKIYGYVARDALLNAKGDVISSRAYIYDEKPILTTTEKTKNGRFQHIEHFWLSSGNSYPAPYGSFIDLKHTDEPRKVLLFIVSDVDFSEDEDGNAIVGTENVEISWKRK